MSIHQVVIYTCDNCAVCNKVLEKMNSWGIEFDEKNVTNNPIYLDELQNRGIFGTPATFVDDHPILGFQENKLKYELSLADNKESYLRKFYEGYDNRHI